jgi:hypothetical protein
MDFYIFEDKKYQEINKQHIIDTISYFFDNNQPFDVMCEYEHISFNPELPSHIVQRFSHTVLFSLVGYTFESARINDEVLEFEAGFGEEQFGSVVTIPLLAIKQIIVEQMPILINLAMVDESQEEVQTSTKLIKDEQKVKNSMEALLKNPKNKKLLKKKS